LKTVEDLSRAFAVYFIEMDRCEKSGAYWALLHIALVMPDICAALEYGPGAKVGERYTSWCHDYFPNDPNFTEDDRYQIRNALLHEGSTLPNKSQYASVSFVEPGATEIEVHQDVTDDGGGKKNLTLDVKKLADETRAAMERWFSSLQHDAKRNEQVASRLSRVARVQTKEAFVPLLTQDGDTILTEDGDRLGFSIKFPTTSST
jgi:hypothetical protein